MIRIRRLNDPAADLEPKQRTDLLEIFRQGFPAYRHYAHSILDAVAGEAELDHDVVLLLAEDARGTVLGFALAYAFAELRLGYLVYIASAPHRRARGIGGTLYRAVRDHLTAKGAHGLLIEVESDDPALITDPVTLHHNRRRIRFYERHGALPIEGSGYAAAQAEFGLRPPLMLLYDPLIRHHALRRADAERAVMRIFGAAYGRAADDPLVRRIVGSFRDDPVRRRIPPHRPHFPEVRPRPVAVWRAVSRSKPWRA